MLLDDVVVFVVVDSLAAVVEDVYWRLICLYMLDLIILFHRAL